MHNARLILLFFIAVLISSCNDDESSANPVTPTGPQNILVVNEGNFGQANGTLSLISPDDSMVTNDVVGQANDGISTGDVVQSIYYSRELIYIISNVENRILVVDSKTFKQVGVIENNLENPRYMLIQDGRLFVTNWGSDFFTSFVAVFNENDLGFQYKIPTDPGTEKIFTDDGQDFWVSNNFTNTVQVFDFNANSIKQTIKVGNAPSGINSMGFEELYVLCQDTFGGSNGYIYQLGKQNYQKLDSIPLGLRPGGQLEINSTPTSKELMFYSGTSIYTFNPSNEFSKSENELADFSSELSSIYAIGLDNKGNLWVADHRGFTQSGLVVKTSIKNPDEIIERYEVGIGPNGFLFLEN